MTTKFDNLNRSIIVINDSFDDKFENINRV